MELSGSVDRSIDSCAVDIAPVASPSRNQTPEKVLFDVYAYAERYTGRYKVLRLIHIATHCKETVETELDALELAYISLEFGKNTKLLKLVTESINGRLGLLYTFNPDSYRVSDLKIGCKIANHMYRLPRAVGKLSIEAEKLPLGKLQYEIGDVRNAFSTLRGVWLVSPDDIINFMLMELEIKPRARTKLLSQRHRELCLNDKQLWFKSRCAVAVSLLKIGLFEHAASMLTKLFSDSGTYAFTDLVSQEDIITYGILCALATTPSQATLEGIYAQRIEPYGLDHSFINFLQDFLAERFPQCIDFLEKEKPNLLLDIFLHEHVEKLFSLIKAKCM